MSNFKVTGRVDAGSVYVNGKHVILEDYTQWGTSGAMAIGNGWTIMWGMTGVAGNQRVTFPRPFNNACYTVVNAPVLGRADWDKSHITAIDKTGFNVDNNAYTCSQAWIAIGY